MSRALLLALLIAGQGCAACGNGSKSPGDQGKSPTKAEAAERIAVPGGDTTVATQTSRPPVAAADDPRFHLKPDEGTLTVGKAEGKVGAETTATLAVAPAEGYHVATDYPIKLSLEAPAGVTLAKSELKAGGRNKDQGDAETLSEQALAFAVKATPEQAGSYEIKGVLKFGICEKESCHPKKQPITITVAAN